MLYWPVSTSAMSIKWSSEAEANIFPSWLKLSVLTGQSSLWHHQQWKEIHDSIKRFESDRKHHSVTCHNVINGCRKQSRWNTNTDWPGEAAHAHQLLHVPQADQSIGTSCGKVFPCGVKLNTDAVGWVSVDGLDGLQLRITANKHTAHFSSEGHDDRQTKDARDSEHWLHEITWLLR